MRRVSHSRPESTGGLKFYLVFIAYFDDSLDFLGAPRQQDSFTSRCINLVIRPKVNSGMRKRIPVRIQQCRVVRDIILAYDVF
jgi:hypothetical protein